jgi:ABC-type branched-subunit amino acid transport system substrate-binding protein
LHGFSNPHDSEKGRRLVEDYKKAGYRESFNEMSAPLAYDATNIILEALRKVGPDDKIALPKK